MEMTGPWNGWLGDLQRWSGFRFGENLHVLQATEMERSGGLGRHKHSGALIFTL